MSASPPVVVDREVISFPGSALIELPYVDKAGRSALSLLVVLFLLSSLDCQLLSELLVESYKSSVLFSVSSFFCLKIVRYLLYVYSKLGRIRLYSLCLLWA